MFRQDPGADLNSMGFVRINIPNPHGVYMHDTPSKGIFGDDFRFVSSGCVRVQNVRDYIAWLLKDTPGWSRDQIDATIQARPAHRREARAAGQRLLDLHHRLGDAGRPRAVPRRHLQPRRARLDPGRPRDRQGAGRERQLSSSARTKQKARPQGGPFALGGSAAPTLIGLASATQAREAARARRVEPWLGALGGLEVRLKKPGNPGTGSAAQRARPGVSQEPAEAAALAEMVGAVLDDIAGSGAGDPGRRRLFFPDGVQLLRAKLSLGPGGGADLEIAGPSGSPAGVASAAVAAPEPHGHARLEFKDCRG